MLHAYTVNCTCIGGAQSEDGSMKTRHPRKTVSNALLAGALVLGGGAAVANEHETLWLDETASEAGEMSASELEDETLHRFIDAAHDIQAIRQEYAERIEQADADERADLQAEAQEKMAQAVEDQGLEVADYREIGHLLENDGELRDRLDRAAAGSSDA